MKKILILAMVLSGVSLVAMDNDPNRVNGNGNYYPYTLDWFGSDINDCPVSPVTTPAPSPVPNQEN